MPKYVVLFSLTDQTMAGFLANPEDRRAPVSKLAEAAGGTLESYYWMFGPYDGLAIFDLPDSAAMAAASFIATSTGAFRQFETHELIGAEDLVAIARRAQAMRASYRPPGQAAAS